MLGYCFVVCLVKLNFRVVSDFDFLHVFKFAKVLSSDSVSIYVCRFCLA